MQINISLCEMSDDSFEYYNTCKSPIKWISTCLINTSPNNASHSRPLWNNYKKTFRGHFISKGEYRLNIERVTKNIKEAMIIHKEKYGTKMSIDEIKQTIIWCCQQYPSIPTSDYETIIEQFI